MRRPLKARLPNAKRIAPPTACWNHMGARWRAWNPAAISGVQPGMKAKTMGKVSTISHHSSTASL
jgi:hypothetical protein